MKPALVGVFKNKPTSSNKPLDELCCHLNDLNDSSGLSVWRFVAPVEDYATATGEVRVIRTTWDSSGEWKTLGDSSTNCNTRTQRLTKKYSTFVAGKTKIKNSNARKYSCSLHAELSTHLYVSCWSKNKNLAFNKFVVHKVSCKTMNHQKRSNNST